MFLGKTDNLESGYFVESCDLPPFCLVNLVLIHCHNICLHSILCNVILGCIWGAIVCQDFRWRHATRHHDATICHRSCGHVTKLIMTQTGQSSESSLKMIVLVNDVDKYTIIKSTGNYKYTIISIVIIQSSSPHWLIISLIRDTQATTSSKTGNDDVAITSLRAQEVRRLEQGRLLGEAYPTD